MLKMNNNQISVIRETTFSASTRQRLSHLDLSGNPFTCSCDVMWFRHWLASNPELFSHSWSVYQCGNIPNKNITSFYMAEQACLMSRDDYNFIAVSVAMLISTLTLVSLLFRYRWHIRLVLYETFRGRGEYRRLRLQQQHFQYDVFVSYASEDLQWVREHLMPELEERLGLRLCIHERDFIPGKPIVDNIEDSLETSKKVMMVFSSGFAQSQWCQFELRLCLSHVMEHDDALLVVFLHDVHAHDMTSTMMAVLKTTTCIEWGEEPDARTSFWGRIQIAFNEILPAAGPEGP
nr:hypothetical protein BaRGS_029419 [Batillaria attramentaria]